MLRKLHIQLNILFFFYAIQTITGQETLRNDGQMRQHPASNTAFYGDFINERLFSNNRGNVFFVGTALQTIQGLSPLLQLDTVLLDNTNGVLIRVPITNSAHLQFINGTISTPRSTPSVYWTFTDDATYTGATDTRHVFGYVSKIGNDTFSFPIGDGLRLRPAAIAQPTVSNAEFKAAYFRGSPSLATLPANAPFPVNRVNTNDLVVSNNEYWDINGDTPTRITLTWNAQSRVDTLSENDISRIVVAGWNGSEWVSLGATSVSGDTWAQGQVTSRTVVPDSFNVYSLAVVKKTCFANAPRLDLGDDLVLCPKDSIKLEAVQGYSRYEWQDGSSDTTIMVKKGGRYWVKAWDICGNSQTDTLEVLAARNIQVTVEPVKCYGETNGAIVLSDTTNMTITLNSLNVKPYQLTELAVDSYRLSLTLAEGCKIDTSFELIQSPFFSVEIGKDTVHIEEGKVLTLEAIPSSSFNPAYYTWTPPQYLSCPTCAKTEARPVGRTTYTITAMDASGCAAIDEITVYVDKKFGLYIPNAFNPEREEFTILSNGEVKNVRHMKIFDRWGTLLYEAKNFKPDGSVGWNGTYRNQLMMRGTYVVSIEAEFKDGEIKTLASEFLLAQ